jgi:hypothetical protein
MKPSDIYTMFRPGSVPCIVAGDFKYRSSELNMSGYFRTNDALSVGYADLFRLREWQLGFIDSVKSKGFDYERKGLEPGNLVLFFCRTSIPKRYRLGEKSKGNYREFDGIDIAEKWLDFLKRVNI